MHGFSDTAVAANKHIKLIKKIFIIMLEFLIYYLLATLTILAFMEFINYCKSDACKEVRSKYIGKYDVIWKVNF